LEKAGFQNVFGWQHAERQTYFTHLNGMTTPAIYVCPASVHALLPAKGKMFHVLCVLCVFEMVVGLVGRISL
jgi:hypothetical protein